MSRKQTTIMVPHPPTHPPPCLCCVLLGLINQFPEIPPKQDPPIHHLSKPRRRPNRQFPLVHAALRIQSRRHRFRYGGATVRTIHRGPNAFTAQCRAMRCLEHAFQCHVPHRGQECVYSGRRRVARVSRSVVPGRGQRAPWTAAIDREGV